MTAEFAVLRSSDGEVVGFVGTIKDVSQRAAADELAERLASLTAQLAPQLHEDEVLDVILDGVFDAVEPKGVGLLLPTEDGTALSPRRHRGLGWSDDEPPLPLDADLPPTRAFREGTAFFFADRDRMVEEFPDVRPLLNERDHHARASLPLRGRHGPTAVLHLLFPSVAVAHPPATQLPARHRRPMRPGTRAGRSLRGPAPRGRTGEGAAARVRGARRRRDALGGRPYRVASGRAGARRPGGFHLFARRRALGAPVALACGVRRRLRRRLGRTADRSSTPGHRRRPRAHADLPRATVTRSPSAIPTRWRRAATPATGPGPPCR